jgi:hypothetical protein
VSQCSAKTRSEDFESSLAAVPVISNILGDRDIRLKKGKIIDDLNSGSGFG